MTSPKNAARRLTARFASTLFLAALGTATAFVPLSAAQADPPSWSRGNDKNDNRSRSRSDYRGSNNSRDNRGNDRDNDRQDRERREREARERQAREDRARQERERWERDRRNSSYDRDRYNGNNGNWNNGNNNRNNDRYNGRDDTRQNTKNNWRNLGVLSSAAAIYGLVKNDKTIAFIGAAGALYSASRYEQDRKSQNDNDRARVAFFDQGYFERDGVRYTRRETWQNNQKYYQFCR